LEERFAALGRSVLAGMYPTNPRKTSVQVPKSLFGVLDGRVTYIIGKDGIVKKVYDNQVNSESAHGCSCW
jgi:hypothetical protein